jgi:predicted unusual protein kinase regulating ubiquinone biosynthesis (AarF/ABC1/UbiB family)
LLTTVVLFDLNSQRQRDTELLLSIAKFLESLPALPMSNTNNKSSSKQTRLINTQLVSATQEFMSRIFEELDYRNEAENCITFANLYSRHGGNSSDVSVVVPEVYTDWCTENVLGERTTYFEHTLFSITLCAYRRYFLFA